MFLQNRNNVNTNMPKDIIMDEANLESMTDLKVFRVQTLLRRSMHRVNLAVLMKEFSAHSG